MYVLVFAYASLCEQKQGSGVFLRSVLPRNHDVVYLGILFLAPRLARQGRDSRPPSQRSGKQGHQNDRMTIEFSQDGKSCYSTTKVEVGDFSGWQRVAVRLLGSQARH